VSYNLSDNHQVRPSISRQSTQKDVKCMLRGDHAHPVHNAVSALPSISGQAALRHTNCSCCGSGNHHTPGLAAPLSSRLEKPGKSGKLGKFGSWSKLRLSWTPAAHSKHSVQQTCAMLLNPRKQTLLQDFNKLVCTCRGLEARCRLADPWHKLAHDQQQLIIRHWTPAHSTMEMLR
jgi:hypothetical protein